MGFGVFIGGHISGSLYRELEYDPLDLTGVLFGGDMFSILLQSTFNFELSREDNSLKESIEWTCLANFCLGSEDSNDSPSNVANPWSSLWCCSTEVDFCQSENSESESLWSELWAGETSSLGKGMAFMRDGRGNMIWQSLFLTG